MLTIPEIFGRAGEVFPPLVASIIVEAVNTPYTFASLPEFQALPPHRVAQVYWQEMLYRVHWAATSNLLRHQRWFESCRILSVEQPNFLGFCTCLRGLAEGAADASHSLGAVPETLATYYNGICAALRGEATSFLVAEALENMLIHFQYARRLERNEQAPQAHRAETAAQYISAIDSAANPVKPLYQELCQMTHPAAQSLHWSTRNVNGEWSATSGNDSESIRDLCKRHLSVIEWIQMQSVNVSIFMFQVLNVFPLESLQANVVRAINMSSMPLWRKIQTALRRQGATWGP